MNDASEPLPGDLASLEAVAAAADAQLDGQALVPGQEPPPERDLPKEFSSMLQMGVMMLTPALPFLPQCYTPQTCDAIGAAFIAVADKHGWNLDVINAPEIALAVVVVPPTAAAVMMGREYFAKKREEAQAGQPAAIAASQAA